VIAQHLTQRLVQEVCRRVVPPYVSASLGIDYKAECLTYFHTPILNMDIVNEQVPGFLVRGQNASNQFALHASDQPTSVPNLTTCFGVEWSLVEYQLSTFAGP
jgi:hypothetical protein